MASMTAKRLICTSSAAVLAFSTVLASGLDFHHQLAIGVALAGNGNGHSGGSGGGTAMGTATGTATATATGIAMLTAHTGMAGRVLLARVRVRVRASSS